MPIFILTNVIYRFRPEDDLGSSFSQSFLFLFSHQSVHGRNKFTQTLLSQSRNTEYR